MNKQFTVEQQLAISAQTEHSLIKSILYLGYFITSLSVIVLLGWYFNVVLLTSVSPDYISMKVNTAVAFFLLGSCFVLNALYRLKIISESYARIITPLGLLVGLFGLLSNIEYFFDTNLGIDQLLFKDINALPGTISGRMAMSTALSFTFVGFTLAYQGTKQRTPTLAQACFLFVLLVGYGGLLGYIFDAPQLSGFGKVNAMAIHTTISFILVGLGGLALYHDHRLIAIVLSPTPAGFSSRRLIPLIVFAPLILGWVRWSFIKADWLEGPLTTAILITFFVAITSYVANNLAWKIHEQYTLQQKALFQISKQKKILQWRQRLITGLIHDLRTPLNAARLTAQVFNRTENISAERAKELSLRMISSIERSDRLLRNLLDSTKAAAGESPHLSVKKAKLYDVLETARTCVTHDPELIQVTCPEDVIGFWDPDAILRIIENLLTNAIKYGNKHGVISLSAQRIPGNKVAISVHNWGPPIPEEDQENIFNLFKRRRLSEHPPGWGIGLNAVKILTTALGGQVSVSSSLRLGTKFTVTFPLDSRNSSLEALA